MRSPVPAPVESDVGVDGWVVELDEQSADPAMPAVPSVSIDEPAEDSRQVPAKPVLNSLFSFEIHAVVPLFSESEVVPFGLDAGHSVRVASVLAPLVSARIMPYDS